ncbi:DUF6498-containing protein [Haladaptatus cibarius]|uniref:DUF6498-containing protein n=1 Tax=Haladaptatus cibarius TaxID=453847 RepID=UPI0034A53825
MNGRNPGNLPSVLCIVLVNLLLIPFATIFDWENGELLFVYLIQNILVIVLYSGFIAFATKEPRLNEYSPRAVLIPFVSTRSGWTQIVNWLPPINY